MYIHLPQHRERRLCLGRPDDIPEDQPLEIFPIDQLLEIALK